MSILKAPPAEPKNETLQLRVSQDLKFRLMRLPNLSMPTLHTS
jgi:hypothetical protein